MVDVSEKTATRRSATARSVVVLPAEVVALVNGNELVTAKGAVFQTAKLAGIMAAKQTGNLIPLCHPLGLDNCHIDITFNEAQEVIIDCTATITAKTGVEMEALVGASIAALTIYDMCKAASHNIIIKETCLLAKTGGKKDFQRCRGYRVGQCRGRVSLLLVLAGTIYTLACNKVVTS
ncbi:MAG: cyclic pyranopterin monophosphate synthase MoaC [Chitinophagia bacterium]|nr:cyclic pyranopterin monophosphate synthase MoaC [Chitinophagia bacterium]